MAVILYKDGEAHRISLRDIKLESLLEGGYTLEKDGKDGIRKNEERRHDEKTRNDEEKESGKDEERRHHAQGREDGRYDEELDALQKRLDALPEDKVRSIGKEMKIGNWHNRKLPGLKKEILNGNSKV